MYKFHYRYQMVQRDSDFVPVQFGSPSVFLDCEQRPLREFSWDRETNFVDLVTPENAPNILVEQIATGRIEHRESVVKNTIALTVLGCLVLLGVLFHKLWV